uniref:Uncharacterized protein n=1 Tax=Arundo donax TaxID=35708 RepID=A0A0A9D6V2_ARUDO
MGPCTIPCISAFQRLSEDKWDLKFLVFICS